MMMMMMMMMSPNGCKKQSRPASQPASEAQKGRKMLWGWVGLGWVGEEERRRQQQQQQQQRQDGMDLTQGEASRRLLACLLLLALLACKLASLKDCQQPAERTNHGTAQDAHLHASSVDGGAGARGRGRGRGARARRAGSRRRSGRRVRGRRRRRRRVRRLAAAVAGLGLGGHATAAAAIIGAGLGRRRLVRRCLGAVDVWRVGSGAGRVRRGTIRIVVVVVVVVRSGGRSRGRRGAARGRSRHNRLVGGRLGGRGEAGPAVRVALRHRVGVEAVRVVLVRRGGARRHAVVVGDLVQVQGGDWGGGQEGGRGGDEDGIGAHCWRLDVVVVVLKI
ncbi:hypothetical protein BKA81DRAFT_233277 [Phyllosticta paracitricarpa]|uniref:Uncharacterized protein n=1 Tax=Phyllosticta paracitricarpa TaxID=2016321 RepID=A0ABR1NF80_9PEZI